MSAKRKRSTCKRISSDPEKRYGGFLYVGQRVEYDGERRVIKALEANGVTSRNVYTVYFADGTQCQWNGHVKFTKKQMHALQDGQRPTGMRGRWQL